MRPHQYARPVSDYLQHRRSTERIKGRKTSRRARLGLELLEDRITPSVTLTGVPTWQSEGPGPELNSQQAFWGGDDDSIRQARDVSGDE
jgi:hypothetical protein